MENNLNKGGFYMILEDLNEESESEKTEAKKEPEERTKDSYNFYPDSSF